MPARAAKRRLIAVAFAIGLCAASTSARGAGFFFTPPPDAPPEVRSVLAGWTVTSTQVDLRIAVEMGRLDADLVWVLPISGGVLEASLQAADVLDAEERSTAPTVRLPRSEPCPSPVDAPTTGCSCGGEEAVPIGTATVAVPPAAIAPWTIRSARVAGPPLEVIVLRDARTDDILTRLTEAGVSTSTTMVAALDAYFQSPASAVWLRFRTPTEAAPLRLPVLQLRLPPDAAVGLPLRATKASAAPRLDVRLLLRAPWPFLTRQWFDLVPRVEEMTFDTEGHTSYAAWVARAATSANGKLLSIEGIEETSRGITTRLYARPAAQALDVDPSFRRHPRDSLRAPSVLDFSSQPSLHLCNEPQPEWDPSPCGQVFCGAGATCLVVDDEPACECGDAAAATVITGPDGRDHIACTSVAVPELSSVPTAVCATLNCGLGDCVPRGSRGLCACDVNAVAVRVDDQPRCVPLPADAPTYGPGGGSEARTLWALLPAERPAPPHTASLALESLLALWAIGLLSAWRRWRRS